MSLLGDFGTIKQRTLDEMDRDRLPDVDQVSMSICQAIQRLRWIPFWFNQQSDISSLTLVTGQADYAAGAGANDYPADLLAPITIRITHPTTLQESEVFPASLDEYRNALGAERGIQRRPRDWTFHNKEIKFSPLPDAAYTVELDYVIDIGTPAYKFVPGAPGSFEFFEPDLTTPLTDDFTNDWFTEGEAVVRAATKVSIYAGFLMDPEKAQAAEQDVQRELSQIASIARMPTPHRTPWTGRKRK